LSAPRNTQLDGWRAFAVLGVIWLHWAPREWRGPLPFEIGLYFFLLLTGFLITRILLREKSAGEASGSTWRGTAYREFQKRRALRILIPCYAAMLFAWIFGAPDLRDHPLPYLTHTVNFHIALMPEYPSGTAHYWTLAIQIQFYLLWPLLVYCAPRRWLPLSLFAFVALAPFSRWLLLHHFPQVINPGAISTSTADYFGIGALLALAMDRGMKAGDRRLGAAAWVAFAAYAMLYCFDEADRPIPGLRHFQQTLLSVALAGLVSATLHGFAGGLGKILGHPVVQHLGKLSYGLYLFHTSIPLAVGKIAPFLWHPVFQGPLLAVRLLVFALASWGIAWLCWRYLEQGLDRFRSPGRRI
jgi:peptidoglycan/LPS O-acetylase OafA/YrhL